jgi:hypothetical protein
MVKRNRRDARLAVIGAEVVEQRVAEERAARTTGAADEALFYVDVPKAKSATSTAAAAGPAKPPSKKRARVDAAAAAAAPSAVAVVAGGRVKVYTRKPKPVVPPSRAEADRIDALAAKVAAGAARAAKLSAVTLTADVMAPVVAAGWGAGGKAAGGGGVKREPLLRPAPSLSGAGAAAAAVRGPGAHLLPSIPALSVNPSVEEHAESVSLAAGRVLAQQEGDAALAASLAGPRDKRSYLAGLKPVHDYDDEEDEVVEQVKGRAAAAGGGKRAAGGGASASSSSSSSAAVAVDAQFLAVARALGGATGKRGAYSLTGDASAPLGAAIEGEEAREAAAAAAGAASGGSRKAAKTAAREPTARGGPGRPVPGLAARKLHALAARLPAQPATEADVPAAVAHPRSVYTASTAATAFIPPLAEELSGSLRTMRLAPTTSVAAEAFGSLVATGLAGSNGGRVGVRTKKAAAEARTKPGRGHPYRAVEFPRRAWASAQPGGDDDE